jgi:hypothetical protein
VRRKAKESVKKPKEKTAGLVQRLKKMNSVFWRFLRAKPNFRSKETLFLVDEEKRHPPFLVSSNPVFVGAASSPHSLTLSLTPSLPPSLPQYSTTPPLRPFSQSSQQQHQSQRLLPPLALTSQNQMPSRHSKNNSVSTSIHMNTHTSHSLTHLAHRPHSLTHSVAFAYFDRLLM